MALDGLGSDIIVFIFIVAFFVCGVIFMALLIVLPILCILLVFSTLVTLIMFVFQCIELFFYKRLADLNCGDLLSTIMNNQCYYEMMNYTMTHGKVDVRLKISKSKNIVVSIIDALDKNELLYVKNALFYITFKEIIYIYQCHRYNADIFIRHLLKNFEINAFLNQIMNDIKPIIYNYYLQLCLI